MWYELHDPLVLAKPKIPSGQISYKTSPSVGDLFVL